MRHIALILLLFYLPIYCMEDLFGIKQLSYQNELHHHLLEYRLGNVLVIQESDASGNIINYSGKILKEDAADLILIHSAAQTTFIQLASLLEAEKQLLIRKIERSKKIN